MSFKFDKFATNCLDENDATGSTSNLTVFRDERRHNSKFNNNNNNNSMLCRTKNSEAFLKDPDDPQYKWFR